MYSFIVGAVDGALAAERLLEVVEDDLEAFVGSSHTPNIGRLLSLPALLTPEMDNSSPSQIAQVGKVVSLSRTGRLYHFHFIPDNTVPPIPGKHLKGAARALHIGDWDLSRTRWSIKNVDLYQALFAERLIGSPSPTVFRLPSTRPTSGHIAIMMPFSPAFSPVWETLKDAAKAGGWTCQRADDIWENSFVIDDVVSLIARSEVVICDATGRNANVFYEAGIAHTLGREVVLITQTEQDVPFDLSHHRYIKYFQHLEGLAKLKTALMLRLKTIISS